MILSGNLVYFCSLRKVPLPGSLGSDAQMWVALHHQCGIIQFIPQTSFYQGPELWCMYNAWGGGGWEGTHYSGCIMPGGGGRVLTIVGV